MEPATFHRKRRDSDSESVASLASASSEPALPRSRSTTPFTLRSRCRHGSQCPEGHGLDFHSRMSQSPKRSIKKTPRRLDSRLENNGSIRKNLLQNLEASYKPNRLNGKSATSSGSRQAGRTQTSDYSSGEEEVRKEEPVAVPSTPLIASPPRSPLPRSAEKTDYTYARSYSYRTAVTPERVIYMPNMTRRSVDAARLSNPTTTLGDHYSSPPLRMVPHSYGGSNQTSTNLKTKGSKGFSYGTDYDSEYELDNDASRYELKPPPGQGGVWVSTSHFLRKLIIKIKDLGFFLSWWIYLITCYSLLLDTLALQSRGASALRSLAKRHKKGLLLFLSLSILVPLALFAGGTLLSALHGLSIDLLDKTANPASNPTDNGATIPILNSPAPTPSPANEDSSANNPTASLSYLNSEDGDPLRANRVQVDQLDRTQTLLQGELKQAQKTISSLQDQIDKLQDTLSLLSADFGTQKEQIVAVSLNQRECCDQVSPESLDKAMENKWAAMLAPFMSQAGIRDAEALASLVRLVQGAKIELDDIAQWKQELQSREKAINEQLSDLQSKMAENEESRMRLQAEVAQGLRDWESRTKPEWLKDLKEQLTVELTKQLEEKLRATSGSLPVSQSRSESGVNREEVERIVRAALAVYDSDKTGIADYALEPAGGVILSTRCTESFNSHRPRLSILGIPLWSEPNNPRVVIQPGNVPGECWSFRGFDGYLVIQLSRVIRPTAFTLEHIPRSLAPDGKIDSAPKDFSVYGLHKEMEPEGGILLGQYTYDEHGPSLQTFNVQKGEKEIGAFPIVELRIHSNYGNRNYTCLYRFRVHGQVVYH